MDAADQLRCTARFSDHLTVGADYTLLGYRPARDLARVRNDHGRTRWYGADRFARIPATSPALLAFTLDDPIVDPHHDYIEVTVLLAGGERRWCGFITLAALATALAGRTIAKTVEHGGMPFGQINSLGDRHTTRDGTVFGAISGPHLIVVTVLTAAVVEETLRNLAGRGNLRDVTLPLDMPDDAGPASGADDPRAGEEQPGAG